MNFDPRADAAADGRFGYPNLLAAAGSWFAAWGIQMVIFQWLVVEVLRQSPARVGAAQMAVTLPSLLFLLLGGATADRIDPKRVLIGVHLGSAAAVAGLGLLLGLEALSYGRLLVLAFAIGTFQAFGFPARDTQLSNVVAGPMSRAVTGATVTQHAGQALGAFVAGSASWLGGEPVLAMQALVLIGGTFPIARLPGRPADGAARPRLALGDLGAGVAEVMRSPTLRPVLIMSVSTGLFFVGPFLVLLPLLVRDVYGGGAAQMGVLTGVFPLGSVIAGLAIVSRGGIEQNGRALVLGQVSAALCIGAIAWGLPFPGTVLAVLGWGMSGGLFINAGRTLFQENASEANRARVLSVYTLGVMGGGPIGSLLSGLLATPLGLHGTLAFDAGVSLSVTLGVVLTTQLISLR